MSDNIPLEEWIQTVSDEERRELMAKTKKRFIIFLLISLIPYVNFFTMGFAIYCYNNWNYLKTRGGNTGNDYIRGLLMLYGFILPPIIGVTLCTKNEKLSQKILGW